MLGARSSHLVGHPSFSTVVVVSASSCSHICDVAPRPSYSCSFPATPALQSPTHTAFLPPSPPLPPRSPTHTAPKTVGTCMFGYRRFPHGSQDADLQKASSCSASFPHSRLCPVDLFQARVVVKPQDTFSNPVNTRHADPSQAGFVVDITGPTGALQASWDLAAARNGELATTYLPIHSGSCSIAVKYRGQHVQQSPYQVSCCLSAIN